MFRNITIDPLNMTPDEARIVIETLKSTQWDLIEKDQDVYCSAYRVTFQLTRTLLRGKSGYVVIENDDSMELAPFLSLHHSGEENVSQEKCEALLSELTTLESKLNTFIQKGNFPVYIDVRANKLASKLAKLIQKIHDFLETASNGEFSLFRIQENLEKLTVAKLRLEIQCNRFISRQDFMTYEELYEKRSGMFERLEALEEALPAPTNNLLCNRLLREIKKSINLFKENLNGTSDKKPSLQAAFLNYMNSSMIKEMIDDCYEKVVKTQLQSSGEVSLYELEKELEELDQFQNDLRPILQNALDIWYGWSYIENDTSSWSETDTQSYSDSDSLSTSVSESSVDSNELQQNSADLYQKSHSSWVSGSTSVSSGNPSIESTDSTVFTTTTTQIKRPSHCSFSFSDDKVRASSTSSSVSSESKTHKATKG